MVSVDRLVIIAGPSGVGKFILDEMKGLQENRIPLLAEQQGKSRKKGVNS